MSVKLLNLETGERELVDDADVDAKVASKKYAAPSVVAVHRMGEDTYATPDVAAQEKAYSPQIDPSLASTATAHAERAQENTGVVAGIKAAVGGGVSGATVGLLDPFEDQQEFNPTLAAVGNIGGSLALGNALGVGELGANVAGRLGGGLLGAAGGSAAEGAIYGVGNAVQELARSNDPLTIDHIVSSLTSNVLLGGGIGGVAGGGFHLAGRALGRAADALQAAAAARDALSGSSGEFAGLDDKALASQLKDATSARTSDIAAEKASLEGLRVNQRAEMANQVLDLHNDLATERPIFSALSRDTKLNPLLSGVDGVGDARVAMAKSYSAIRSIADNPIAAAENPWKFIEPLQKRQGALETLQAKLPEMHAAFASDAQGAALEHIDAALEQTKKQIADIKSLDSRTNPVASGRLAQLTSGPGELEQKIAAARDALKNAPELGLVAKGAKSAAFAGGTAVAHMIPGVGIMAPFAGKWASDMVGKLFGHLATGVADQGAKMATATQAFLGIGEKLADAAPVTATKVLAQAKFAKGPEPKSDGLVDLFHARSAELRSQTMLAPDGSTQMRPEARQAVARMLSAIAAVNPIMADRIETQVAARTAYMSSVIPKRPEAPGLQIGPDTWRPSDMAIRSCARAWRAAEDPHGVELRLAQGITTPEEAKAYRACYPARFQALQQAIFQAAPQLAKTLPMGKKVALSIFTGIPVTPAMRPEMVQLLQRTFAVEPGSAGGTQAPKPTPNFGKYGTPKDTDKPTPNQERQQ